tara:strand:- start:426 stop:1403 length:978 start_codon:yes stop_codon:yes gene_type:complete
MKKIILINFFSVIAILLFLEIIVGVFKLSNLMGIDKHLILYKSQSEYKFHPNSSGKVFNEMIFTDNFGFRVPRKNFKYLKKKSIIFFGDSVAFGNGVEEENTFIGIIRRELNNYNVYNLSLPGYQANHHKFNIKYLNKVKNIEKVFYVFTLNDIKELSNIKIMKSDDGSQKKKIFKTLKKVKLFQHVNSYLRNKSYLYLFLKGIASDPSQRWFKIDREFYQNNNLKSFENILSQFKNQTTKKNVDFKVIILPYEYQTRKGNCKTDILLPQINIEKLLIKNDIAYIDLTKEFCNYNKPKKLFYKFDPMHLSEEGHKFLFNLLKNEI